MFKGFDDEIDFLYYIIRRWWANLIVHEQVDEINLEETFERLRQRAKETVDIWDYAVALREELWTLGDGHLKVIKSLHNNELLFKSNVLFAPVKDGVGLVSAESQAVVDDSSICPERGDLLVEIQGCPTETYLQSVRLQPGSSPMHRLWNAIISLSYQERFLNEVTSPTEVTLQKENGEFYLLPISWLPLSKNRPTPNCVRSEMVDKDIAYIEIRSFSCRDEFGQIGDAEFYRQTMSAATTIESFDHLIVDIRRNCGGRDQQAQIASSLFSTEPMEWFKYRHREPYKSIKTLEPEMVYTNPLMWSVPKSFHSAQLWFLIGPGCFSTSEVFASALKNKREVIFIGEPTAGGAGNPQEFHLPYSGISITIPVSEFYMAGENLTPIEANGIVPDFTVVQTIANLLTGRDIVLERALSAVKEFRR